MIESITDNQPLKLGEVLVQAGLLQSGDVVEAAQVSRRLKVPIGRVLIASGCIREDLLQAALEAQHLLRDDRVKMETAAEALQHVSNSDISFEEALFELHWIGSYNRELGNLAEMLLDSDIVTEQQLEIARTTSSSTQLPLGSALVLEGVLSPKFFPTIMQIQERVIAGQMSRKQATAQLRSAFMLWVKAEESFSEDDGLPKMQSIDETKTHESGNSARATNQALSFTMDADFLSAQSSESQQDDGYASLVDLLTQAGTVERKQVQQAFAKMLTDPELTGRLLLALELIDDTTFKCALRSHKLLSKRLINKDQAVQMIQTGRQDKPVELERSARKNDEPRADAPVVMFSERATKRKRTIGGAILAASIAGLAAAALNSKRR